MPKSRCIHYYSLIEVLAVIALVAILFNGALFLFYHGNRLSTKATDRAQTLKSASALAQAWRMLVRNNPGGVKCVSERVDFANGSFAALQNGRLIFYDAQANTRGFSLPKGATVSFDREELPGEKPLLVLYLRPKGSREQKIEDKFIRIAAVLKEASSESGNKQ